MTYEHIGGGWECVNAFGGDEAALNDAFPMPAFHPGEWYPPSALTVSFEQMMMGLVYADRKLEAITCDIQPIHGQPFATVAVRTLAMIEDYRKHMLRMACRRNI